MDDIGKRFQQETKYHRGKLPSGRLDLSKRPQPYKRYPGNPEIALPSPERRGGPGLWAVMAARRSVRSFGSTSLEPVHLSQLLWAAQGITAEHFGYRFRTAPSAGALYPVETYLVVNRVRDIPSGVYHYSVERHSLEELRRGDFRTSLAGASLDQKVVYEACAVFVWTAVFRRCTWKYRERGYRYVYLDAGHIAQNVALAAVGLGLGSCQIGALYDDEVNELLGVDGTEESALYLTAVGEPTG